MGNKPSISRDQILTTAFSLANEHGLAGLGIREVADACSVSVGSVYNYFPSKAHLISEVVGHYWESSLPKKELHARLGEGFLPFCRRLSACVAGPVRQFREKWACQAKSLDAKSLAVAHAQEEKFFSHIEKGLQTVLLRDETIDRSRLSGGLAPEKLCPFVWRSILEAHRRGDGSEEVLFDLLEQVLW